REIHHDQDATIHLHSAPLENCPLKAYALGAEVSPSRVRARSLNACGERVSGRTPGSNPQLSICSTLTRLRRALRRVLRRWEKASATRGAKCGLTANAGSGRTVSRATADHTRGGGLKAPGPTSNKCSTVTHGASMTVSRP